MAKISEDFDMQDASDDPFWAGLPEEEINAPNTDPYVLHSRADSFSEFNAKLVRADALQRYLDLEEFRNQCSEWEVETEAHTPESVWPRGDPEDWQKTRRQGCCDREPDQYLSIGIKDIEQIRSKPLKEEYRRIQARENESRWVFNNLGRARWKKWRNEQFDTESIEAHLLQLDRKEAREKDKIEDMLKREAIAQIEEVQLQELSQLPPDFQTDDEKELLVKLKEKSWARWKKADWKRRDLEDREDRIECVAAWREERRLRTSEAKL